MDRNKSASFWTMHEIRLQKNAVALHYCFLATGAAGGKKKKKVAKHIYISVISRWLWKVVVKKKNKIQSLVLINKSIIAWDFRPPWTWMHDWRSTFCISLNFFSRCIFFSFLASHTCDAQICILIHFQCIFIGDILNVVFEHFLSL